MRHGVLQDRLYVYAELGGDLRRVHGGYADDLFYLFLDLFRLGSGKVYFVYYRKYLKIVVEGEIGVAESLRLHALPGVHDEQRALAGGKAARDLVVEVHVARSVDKVEMVFLSVPGPVFQADRAGLDGDAALAFYIHVVEQLALHVAGVYGVAQLQQPVGEGALAVIYMRNYGKIAYHVALWHTYLQ